MAVMRSTSKPVALLVVVSIYSCGGYVVSLPTVKVPGVIRSLGGVKVGVLGLGVGTAPVLLLLPQVASKMARTRKPSTRYKHGTRIVQTFCRADVRDAPTLIRCL